MNYGALGFIAAHEITHAFDDWWQPETKEKYQSKIKCIIEQYGNYTVDIMEKKIFLNGILTKGESQGQISFRYTFFMDTLICSLIASNFKKSYLFFFIRNLFLKASYIILINFRKTIFFSIPLKNSKYF